MSRLRPRSRAAAWTITPLLAGAVAASAGVLLLGWPQRPLPGQAGTVAAAALVVVAVLLVFAPCNGARVRRRG